MASPLLRGSWISSPPRIKSGTAFSGDRYGSRLPERLVDLVGNVVPRQADIVQVALGPATQFLTDLVTMPPDVKHFRDLGPNPDFMMISHRFMGASRHFRLL